MPRALIRIAAVVTTPVASPLDAHAPRTGVLDTGNSSWLYHGSLLVHQGCRVSHVIRLLGDKRKMSRYMSVNFPFNKFTWTLRSGNTLSYEVCTVHVSAYI